MVLTATYLAPLAAQMMIVMPRPVLAMTAGRAGRVYSVMMTVPRGAIYLMRMSVTCPTVPPNSNVISTI